MADAAARYAPAATEATARRQAGVDAVVGDPSRGEAEAVTWTREARGARRARRADATRLTAATVADIAISLRNLGTGSKEGAFPGARGSGRRTVGVAGGEDADRTNIFGAPSRRRASRRPGFG